VVLALGCVQYLAPHPDFLLLDLLSFEESASVSTHITHNVYLSCESFLRVHMTPTFVNNLLLLGHAFRFPLYEPCVPSYVFFSLQIAPTYLPDQCLHVWDVINHSALETKTLYYSVANL